MNEVAKSTNYFESFDGTKIYYEERGSGQPIVFVYGIACLMNHWHHQLSFFSQNYHVITFDLRGHHKSDTPEDTKQLTIEAISKDIECLLKHLGLTKAHFVGHSFGAPVLIQYAHTNPEQMLTLTLINGFASNPIKGMFGLDVIEPLYHFIRTQYDLNPKLWEMIWKKATNNPLSILMTGLAGGFNLKLTQFKDIEVYARGVSQIQLSVFLPLFQNMMNFSGEQYLETIQIPTLILSGEKDSVTPIKYQQHMHEKIKGSDFVVVPYGSHCTQLDFPDYTNLKIEKHLLEK